MFVHFSLFFFHFSFIFFQFRSVSFSFVHFLSFSFIFCYFSFILSVSLCFVSLFLCFFSDDDISTIGQISILTTQKTVPLRKFGEHTKTPGIQNRRVEVLNRPSHHSQGRDGDPNPSLLRPIPSKSQLSSRDKKEMDRTIDPENPEKSNQAYERYEIPPQNNKQDTCASCETWPKQYKKHYRNHQED